MKRPDSTPSQTRPSMQGAFAHPAYGRFTLRGHEPIDLLWDLFDQVAGGHDADGWTRRHSAYFCRLLSRDRLPYTVIIPQHLYFELHCITLLGAVLPDGAEAPESPFDPAVVVDALLLSGALTMRRPD